MMRKTTAFVKKQNTFAELLHEHDKHATLYQKFDLKSFRKAMFVLKFNSWIGSAWDVFQVVLSLVACAVYVSETYIHTYQAVQIFDAIENAITQFFLIDFLWSWFTSSSTRQFFLQFMTWIDVATILPVYVGYIVPDSAAPNLSILRFLRILRLIRILRTFRMLGGFSGVKRQSINLSLAMISLIFLAAGVVHILENELNSQGYDCQHINALTRYEPSCEASYPTFEDPSCDCKEHHCEPEYQSHDSNHEPSKVKCTDLSFFNSLYFIIITIYPVGYGSMITNNYSRMAVIVVIITSIIVIQMQVNKLSQLYSMISPFRAPYTKHFQDKHVLLCGFVHDKEKLGRFLREFFHPDRQNPRLPGFHLVVLGPVEPSPDLVDLINSPLFEGRLFYIIGSALNIQDLVKARADSAAAIMFLSNPELDSVGTVLDDAATVLRTMSVINFNPDMECLVQVLQTSDSNLLKDSDADMVLCMDDYKTTLQARNAMCPGLSSFVENIFHSFGSGRNSISKPTEHWLSEYKYGLQMELYYIRIDKELFKRLNFNWRLLVEAIFLEYGCMLLGVCRESDQGLYLNPGKAEMQKFSSALKFFSSYTIGVLLAPDDASANAIAFALSDPLLMENIIEHLVLDEEIFAVRTQVTEAPVETALAARRGSSVNIGARTFRKMSHTLNLGTGFIGNVMSPQEKALATIKHSQQLIDADFAPDLDRRRSIRKKAQSNSTTQPDSDSSDEEFRGLNFVGYIDSDSDDQSEVKHEGGVQLAEGESQLSQSPPPKENPSPKRNLKYFAGRVVKDLHNDRNKAWINAIQALNIHGEQECVDDASTLSLLQPRPRRQSVVSGKMSKFQGISAFKSVANMSPNPAKVQPSPLQRGNGVLISSPKSIAGGLANCKASDGCRQVVDTKRVKRRLSLNQKMEGFRKKSQSSSFTSLPRESLPSSPCNSLRCSPLSSAPISEEDEDEDEDNAVVEPEHTLDGFGQSSYFLAKAPNAPDRPVVVENLKERVLNFLNHSDAVSMDESNTAPLSDQKTDNLSNCPTHRSLAPQSREFGSYDQKQFGHCRPSREVHNSDELDGHIIVMGCLDSVLLFLRELRKSHPSESSYHSVLIVHDTVPAQWDFIKRNFDDVYFLQSRARSSGEEELAAMNIQCAHAVVLLASREKKSMDEATNIDSAAIFTYLKLHTCVPHHVFFTVELFLASSIGMLNTVIMRHLKNTDDDELQEINRSRTSTGIAVSRSRRRNSTLMVSGSVDVALFFKEQSLLSLTKANLGFSADHHNEMLRDIEAQRKSLKSSRSSHNLRVKPGHLSPSGSFRRQAMMLSPSDSDGSLMLKEEVLAESKYSRELPGRDSKRQGGISEANQFWDAEGTHHLLPVCAASRVFVPTGFDSIFCNSFFATFTPQICEKLICGQEHQTMHNIEIPNSFWDRKFGELFRAMNCRGVLPVALYRHQHHKNEALMPYVYSNPYADTLLSRGDRALVFGNADCLKKVVAAISLPLVRQVGTASKFSLHPRALKAPQASLAPPPFRSPLAPHAPQTPLSPFKVKAQKIYP